MAYQYGPCSPRREKKQPMITPADSDLELALRDVAEVGYDCARRWSQYVIEWFENQRSAATRRAWQLFIA